MRGSDTSVISVPYYRGVGGCSISSENQRAKVLFEGKVRE